jgi:hypothetical protein
MRIVESTERAEEGVPYVDGLAPQSARTAGASSAGLRGIRCAGYNSWMCLNASA